MFFNINDSEIKNEIIAYIGNDQNNFEIILEKITPFIYNYPRVVFHVTDDTCSEFYEYMLIRLESILKSYSISEAKFTTWFTVVLRNRFLNFLRKGNKKDNTQYDLSFDRIIQDDKGNEVNLYMKIADKKSYDVFSNEKVINSVIDKITSLLNDKYRVLFHLYYIDLIRVEDVRFLSIFFNRKLEEINRGIDIIKSSIINKYEKKEVVLNKLTKNYESILEYQKLGDKKLEKNAKEIQKNLLNEYRAIKYFPSYESIASFCGFPIGTVSAGIARIKSKIRNVEGELRKITEKTVQ